MDDDVNWMGVVRSIESELLDVRSRIGEKYAIPVFWCQTIPKWPWQILRAVLRVEDRETKTTAVVVRVSSRDHVWSGSTSCKTV
jgi:hypothetical protein